MISHCLLSGPGQKYYTQQWGWRTWRGVERNGGDNQGGGRGGGGGEKGGGGGEKRMTRRWEKRGETSYEEYPLYPVG